MKAAVIMAARGVDRYIAYAVESLQQQTVPVDLLIAVDRCPATAQVLERLGVPYAWSDTHVGPYVLRNSLIAQAPEAPHYHIFDADDIAEPTHCEILAQLAGDAGIAGPSVLEWSGRTGFDETQRPFCRYKPFAGGRPTISRSAWQALGGFRAKHVGCDSDFLWRARAMKIRVVPSSVPTVIARRHRNSQTRNQATGFQSTYRRQCVEYFRERLALGEYIVVPETTPLERHG